MSDVDVDEAFVNAVDVLEDAESAQRDVLQRLWFHELTTLLLRFHEQAADIMAMLRAQMGAAQPPTGPDGGGGDRAASSVLAAILAERHADEQAALALCEDVCGRRRVLLDEAEARERLWLTMRCGELTRCIVEAFAPCVTQSYSHAWDVRVHHVLPLRPHALDRLDKNAERHLPPHMRSDARAAAVCAYAAASATPSSRCSSAPLQPLEAAAGAAQEQPQACTMAAAAAV